jgi:hypothetical protein
MSSEENLNSTVEAVNSLWQIRERPILNRPLEDMALQSEQGKSDSSISTQLTRLDQ